MSSSRRAVLGGLATAIVMILPGCTSKSMHRQAVSEFNSDLSSPIFAYLSGFGAFDSTPDLHVDVYQDNIPTHVTLRRPDGEEVDSVQVTEDDPSHLERSDARMGLLSLDGEGAYELHGRGEDGIADTIRFYARFEREWGIGRRVVVFDKE